MWNNDEIIEAQKRAIEYRQTAEEYCPNGGFLFGDDECKDVSQKMSGIAANTESNE
jgi:hypothetical protein